MSEKIIVTIGRQFGSNGRKIAFKLAEDLGIKCYDKELITLAAQESGINSEIMEYHDEKPTSSFLYSMVMDSASMGYSSPNILNMPLNHKVYLAEFEVIKKIAKEGSCIIVGRCADYVLKDDPDLISIFIYAPLQKRISFVAATESISESKASTLIHKTDKNRANYYNYYSDKKWANVESYHLSADSSELDIDGTVELLKSYIKIKKNTVQ
ncbi:cytidylate kinase-like family protein [Parasporobacterium paucivorans]|uniref:Cytidylate kinase n=1 Tax=Parasporobacterium paucivorans DSM 15970 TaxID=1122934 RepID=A0A1M6A449_9FIRM|nr:cytidylate kinase-like family protein [Parasporobacterium paucivorans]SHI31195.1 cytidylate kinase [Parasporobacterium paucivorans DSM 15970]